MITNGTEPGSFAEFIPGEQLPPLPGGVRFPALVGESQTFLLRENVIVTKGGLLSFSYNSLTGLMTTDSAHSATDILNIVAMRRSGQDFEVVFTGNNTTNIDLADISLAGGDISAVRVGGVTFVPTPAPVIHPISITGAGYDTRVITITAGDSITWTNSDTVAHGIKNDPTSEEIFDSAPTNMAPTQTFTHQFNVTGTFTYFDPLLPQDTLFTGVVIVEPFFGYSYDEPTRELSFTVDVGVAKNQIEVDTIFNTGSLPVTIRLDGNGTSGPYDLDISPPQIRQILKVQLMDVADPLPDTGVIEIVRVGNTPFSSDYTPLDYILVNDTISWGAAASKAADVISPLSTESFVDKVFVSIGSDLQVQDNTWILTVVVAGTTGTGTYSIKNGKTNALVGTFTTSAGVVPGSPIPGTNLIVTETTGTTPGDTVVVTSNAGTASEPNAGDKYFVTYKIRKSDFRPITLFRFADIRRIFGPIVREFNANGTIRSINNLSLAAFLAMVNGAPGVIMAQTDFGLSGVSTSTDFIDAIDRLKEVDEVGTVVPLTSDNIVRDYAKVHVLDASSPLMRRERMAFVSAAPGSSIEELIGVAQGLADKRVVLVTPTQATTEVQDTQGNPVIIAVEGFFLAAAMSGLNHSTRWDVAEPLTRKSIAGFRSLEGEFLKPERDRLSENGVLILQTKGGSVSVRQSITTSVASIEEREISITKITDFTGRAVRQACDRFVGQKLVDETPIWVEAAIGSILQSLVSDKIIQAFASISAFQDPNRPDMIQAEFSFKPIYPVNFVRIRFSINGRL